MAIRDRAPVDRMSVIANPCGRCGGTGKLPFLNEATMEADEAYCGICGGSGYGTLRFDAIGAQSSPIPGTRHFADGISSVRSAGTSRSSGKGGKR